MWRILGGGDGSWLFVIGNWGGCRWGMGVVGERRLVWVWVVDYMVVVFLGRNGEVCGEGMGGDEWNGVVFLWC